MSVAHSNVRNGAVEMHNLGVVRDWPGADFEEFRWSQRATRRTPPEKREVDRERSRSVSFGLLLTIQFFQHFEFVDERFILIF